jgi:ABC-type phosphate transport system substrate-binding protein
VYRREKMKKLAMLCIGILFFLQVSAFAENIAVIVNSESPLFSVKASAELKDVKDVYLGKIKYWKGAAIKAVNQKDKNIISMFVQKACGMRISEYQNYWVKLALESGSDAPKVIEASKEVISFVQRETAGIGYVLESEAKDIEGIKTILLINE